MFGSQSLLFFRGINVFVAVIDWVRATLQWQANPTLYAPPSHSYFNGLK